MNKKEFLIELLIVIIGGLIFAFYMRWNIRQDNKVFWKEVFVVEVMKDEDHLYVKDTEGNWYKSFMPRNEEQTQELCKEYRTGNIDEEKPYKVKLNKTWYDVLQE